MMRLTTKEGGQSAVMFTLILLLIVGLAALVIDVGLAMREKSRVQGVADAAALAGAWELPEDPDAAVAAAEQYIVKHGIGLDDPKYEISITTPYNGDDGRIEVVIKSEVDFILGSAVGVSSATVPGRAVADAEPGAGGPVSDASIIALNPSECKSLEINAGGAFKAEGPVMINSDCHPFASEIKCGSTCHMDGGIESVGDVKTDNKCKNCDVTDIDHFEDPLAHVLPPCFAGSPTPCQDVGTLVVRNGTAASPQKLTEPNFDFQPGIYYGGIDVGDNTKPWAPGIYVIAGGGFKINTSTSFQAEGVMIYNTNDPGCPNCSNGGYGSVEIHTSSSAHMTGPTTPPYKGLLFFQDRDNTHGAVFNPSASFAEGTLYFASAHVDMNPGASTRMQVIADTVKINTSASFTAAYDGDSFYSEDDGNYLKLVE